MVSTHWASAGERPLLGSGLSTTPEDYGRFLNSYFNGRLVSLETRAEMERSHYPDAALTGVAALQGRYGLGVRAILLSTIDPPSIRQHQTVP
jgi:CubicO group peptidase (beta-lactamase class C family)